jgi:hypothetical protein
MNVIHLVTLTLNGAAVFRYADGRDPGAANAEAGAILDSLTDRYGDGFGYRVEPLPYRRSIDNGAALQAACSAYESGAWSASALAESMAGVKAAALKLRTMAAELESGL